MIANIDVITLTRNTFSDQFENVLQPIQERLLIRMQTNFSLIHNFDSFYRSIQRLLSLNYTPALIIMIRWRRWSINNAYFNIRMIRVCKVRLNRSKLNLELFRDWFFLVMKNQRYRDERSLFVNKRYIQHVEINVKGESFIVCFLFK